MKQTDANTVKTSELVRKELAKIQQERNLDFEVDVVYDAAPMCSDPSTAPSA